MRTALVWEHTALHQHAYAAAISLAIGLVGAGLLAYDRRAPLQVEHGALLPGKTRAGSDLTIRWDVRWTRHCEGEMFRQAVGADLVMHTYREQWVPRPAELGAQTLHSEFTAAKSIPAGTVLYEAFLRFQNCGVTSRWWPLEVTAPTLRFEVVP